MSDKETSGPEPPKARSADPGMDRLNELADFLETRGLKELEFDDGSIHVRLVHSDGREAQGSGPTVLGSPPPPPASDADPEAGGERFVCSPMVGTAYRRPMPHNPPYVEVGHTVESGQPLLVIEAMKTFNDVPAPHAGIVREILFEDGQSVEFGEPLMHLEPLAP